MRDPVVVASPCARSTPLPSPLVIVQEADETLFEWMVNPFTPLYGDVQAAVETGRTPRPGPGRARLLEADGLESDQVGGQA